MLVRMVIHWAILAVAIGVAAWLVPGFEVSGGAGGLVLLAAVFGLVNAVIGPILRLLTLPLRIITLGLITLVVNAVLLAITAGLSKWLSIDNFWHALVAAVVITVVSTALGLILRPRMHAG